MQQTVTRRIGFFLLVPTLGALVVLAYFYFMLTQISTDTPYVDLAGRQRLLAQQILHTVNELRHGVSPAVTRVQLADTVRAYDAALAILTHGGVVRAERVSPPPPEVADEVARLAGAWQQLRPVVLVLVAGTAGRDEQERAAAQLRSAAPVLVTGAEELVAAFAAWDRGVHRTALWLLLAVVALDIAALIAAVLYLAHHGRVRERLTRFYAALSETNAAVMHSDGVEALYREVCRIAVRQGRVMGAWVGVVDRSEERLVPTAQCCMDLDYLTALNISTHAERGASAGPSGAAVRSGEPVVCNDFLRDARTAPWHAAARAAGIRASAAFPLRQDGAVVGALNLYAGEPEFFTADLVELLVKMAQDISYALDHFSQQAQRVAAEAALRRAHDELEQRVRDRTLALSTSHQLLSAVFDNTHVLIAYLDPELNFVRVNRAYAAADAKTPEYFPGRNHFALYPNPDNEAIFRRAVVTGEPVRVAAEPFEYAYNPERGVSHWDWTLTPIKDEQGRVTGLVLALLNVSERIVALEQLRGRERELAGLNAGLEERVLQRTAELQAERNLVAAILDVVGALIIVLDRDGRVRRFNKACEALTGYRFEEVEGREFWQLLLPDDERAGVEAVFRGLATGQFPNIHENDWLTRTGERRRIAWSNTCLTDADGTVTHVIGTGMDITAQRRAESALRDSELRFRNLVESTNDWVWEMDEQGRYTYASPQVQALLGYTPEEILGRTPFEFMPAEEAQRVDTEFGRIVASRAPFAGLLNVNLHRSGRRVVLETSGVPIFDAGGRLRGYRGIDRDVTGREREQEALRQSEELFRQLAENIREVFFVRDAHHNRMIYVSPAYDDIWGRSRAELYADPTAFMHGVHPDDRERVLAALQAQHASGRLFNEEYRIVRPDGSERWLWARAFPICNANGEAYRIAGLVEDITERRQAEQQRLEHARHQRETLVREVHHRIKNNLQGVVGMLRQQASREPAVAPLIDAAIAQVSAVAVVHGLQAKSRQERLLLCDVTRAICQTVSGLTGIQVEPQFVPRMPLHIQLAPSEAVPVALILNEVVVNAVKHGQGGVCVDIRLEHGVAVVQVRNAGRLPPGFDFAAGQALGTGLSLVRALLPPAGVRLGVAPAGEEVVAELRLQAPAIQCLPQATEPGREDVQV
jgi:PAS domain S-box-containing protein